MEPEPVLVMVKPRKHRIHTYLYRRYETSGLRTEEQLQLFGSLLLLIAALFRFINSVLVLFFIGYGLFLTIGVFVGYVTIHLP